MIDGIGSYQTPSVGAMNYNSGIYKTTYTDKNGHFNITLKGTFPGVSVTPIKDSCEYYQPNESSMPSISYDAGGNYTNQILLLKADASFSPIFKSKVPSSNSDTLKVLDLYFYSGITIWLPDCIYIGKGPFILYYYPQDAMGNTYRYFRMSIYRGGQLQIKTDSVYIKGFTVFKDTIYY